MSYELPTSVEICGLAYEIRSDYRVALDICAALADEELEDADRAAALLDIFYPGFADMPPEHYDEAIRQFFVFLNCGQESGGEKAPKLMDWEQDFSYIAAPVNRVLGREIRTMDYLHWWTFLGAYYEIGDCLFAQIVRIREKLAAGKPLDKSDREWYRKNRQLVDLKAKYTREEDALLQKWVGG